MGSHLVPECPPPLHQGAEGPTYPPRPHPLLTGGAGDNQGGGGSVARRPRILCSIDHGNFHHQIPSSYAEIRENKRRALWPARELRLQPGIRLRIDWRQNL